MKETELPSPEQTEIHSQKEHKKELKHIGRVTLRPGQKLWEYNRKTFVIKQAEYETTTALEANGNVKTTKKLVVKDDCTYVISINAANADYKLLRMRGVNVPRPGKVSRTKN